MGSGHSFEYLSYGSTICSGKLGKKEIANVDFIYNYLTRSAATQVSCQDIYILWTGVQLGLLRNNFNCFRDLIVAKDSVAVNAILKNMGGIELNARWAADPYLRGLPDTYNIKYNHELQMIHAVAPSIQAALNYLRIALRRVLGSDEIPPTPAQLAVLNPINISLVLRDICQALARLEPKREQFSGMSGKYRAPWYVGEPTRTFWDRYPLPPRGTYDPLEDYFSNSLGTWRRAQYEGLTAPKGAYEQFSWPAYPSRLARKALAPFGWTQGRERFDSVGGSRTPAPAQVVTDYLTDHRLWKRYYDGSLHDYGRVEHFDRDYDGYYNSAVQKWKIDNAKRKEWEHWQAPAVPAEEQFPLRHAPLHERFTVAPPWYAVNQPYVSQYPNDILDAQQDDVRFYKILKRQNGLQEHVTEPKYRGGKVYDVFHPPDYAETGGLTDYLR